MKRSTLLMALVGSGLLASLSGCSTIQSIFRSTPVDYQNTTQIAKLEVPPDLTSPSTDSQYQVQGNTKPGNATWSSWSASQQNTAKPDTTQAEATPQPASAESGASEVLPAAPAGVRLERDGCERWLVIDAPAEKVWPVLEQFWKDKGYDLVENNPQLGLLQTGWKESASRLPQDIIHSTLGKVLPSLYSSDQRNAFRTRIERDAAHPGQTEVYVSERSVTQVYDNSIDGLHTQWQRLPPDPGAEALVLEDLMGRFGVPKPKAQVMVAATPAASGLAHLNQSADGGQVLTDQEPFDRAWRRVGLALDRVGYNVVDRDRTKGVYFVTEARTNVDNSQSGGFWNKLEFWKHTGDNFNQYQVELDENATATSTDIHILSATGKTAPADVTKRILGKLYDQLK